MFRRLGLQDYQAPLTLSPCPSADLRHHHKGMFVGPEVRIVEHRVGIEDTHHADTVEVESLGDHLGADKEIGAPSGEIVDQSLVGSTGAGGVKIHTGNTGLRKDIAHLIFNLLRAKAPCHQLCTAASRALRGHLIGIAAVVARQLVKTAMIGQRHVTVLTTGHPSALLALQHGGIATTVLEEDDLLAMLQGLTRLDEQKRRERTVHHLTMLQVLGIDNLYLR